VLRELEDLAYNLATSRGLPTFPWAR